MAKKRPPNKVHTSPERSGEDNLKGIDLPKDEDGLMSKLMPVREEGKKYKMAYKGLWTDEALGDAIDRFFGYCANLELKPTIPLLTSWLGVTRQQMYNWRTDKNKYGGKFDLVNEAINLMECYLQANIDKYPTGSAFLLRTSFGHVEQSKVNIETNTPVQEDVKDLISKMGLDKEDAE